MYSLVNTEGSLNMQYYCETISFCVLNFLDSFGMTVMALNSNQAKLYIISWPHLLYNKHAFVHDFMFFPVKQSRIIFLFSSNLFVQPRLFSF